MQKTLAPTQGWLTIKNASAITGYNPEYIRQLVRAGQVAAHKNGTAIMVDPESLSYYQATKSNSSRPSSNLLKRPVLKNRLKEHKAKGADAQLTSDPYLTDVAIRRFRNQIVIEHLDALSAASPVEAKEQQDTYQFLRRSLDQNRLSERKRFRSNTPKGKAKREIGI